MEGILASHHNPRAASQYHFRSRSWLPRLPRRQIYTVHPCRHTQKLSNEAHSSNLQANDLLSACLNCRGAKVRCLSLRGADRCNRCVTNNIECCYERPKRSRARTRQALQPICAARRTSVTLQDHDRRVTTVSEQPAPLRPSSSPSAIDELASTFRVQTSSPSQRDTTSTIDILQSTQQQQLITAEIRARIIATLATLKGKRGAPFSFITSGEKEPFNCSPTERESSSNELSQQSNPNSLKLSWLLRPLKSPVGSQTNDDPYSAPPTWVKMPSYTSSMTLGQTVIDPIIGGIISLPASEALFHHFMVEMNARWEYLLEPVTDTHYNVRQRSPFLFATVLYCASKFATYNSGRIVHETDPFLQTRLCSVARNLAIRTMAEGDRSIEGIQAFYLLVCWKDPDDDISYLHTGYASRILQDLDLEQWDGDERQALRRRRTWLALYRQDKQQNLFFMRKSSGSFADEERVSRIGDIFTWIQSPHSTLLDVIACCSADLRRIQCRLRSMVQKASPTMLPCLVEVMDTDLAKWNSAWRNHLEDKRKAPSIDNGTASQDTVNPGMEHLNTLLGLWEHSVRLHISSAILRQALTASVSASLRSRGEHPDSSLDNDVPNIAKFLSTDTPGLNGSVIGALETLRHLLAFPSNHLRHAPDALALLAPNAALFLCQLLSLPGTGILGSHFQKTAVGLIKGITNQLKNLIQSPQDTLTLHSAYLDSLLKLLHPGTSLCMEAVEQPTPVVPLSHDLFDERVSRYHGTATQAAYVGVGGIPESTNTGLCLSQELDLDLHMHGLANLLDIDYFWEIPPASMDVSVGNEGRNR